VFRLVELLVALVLVLVLVVLIILLKLFGSIGKISVDQDAIKGAIATCWKELRMDQDMARLKRERRTL